MDSVLLLGMGPTALSALESLARELPGRRSRPGARSSPEGDDEVVERARALDVPVLSDLSIEGVEQAVVQSQPDCVVVSSYNRILPSRVLARCRFVNVHYAPLPEYRGRANVNWAIINGEPETAVTIHVMAPGLDAGNVLYQQGVPIGPDDTVGDLYTKLNEVQRQVLGETVARYISGYEGEPQVETAAVHMDAPGFLRTARSTGQLRPSRSMPSSGRSGRRIRARIPFWTPAASPFSAPPRHECATLCRPHSREGGGLGHAGTATWTCLPAMACSGFTKWRQMTPLPGRLRLSSRSTKQTLGLHTADLFAGSNCWSRGSTCRWCKPGLRELRYTSWARQ